MKTVRLHRPYIPTKKETKNGDIIPIDEYVYIPKLLYNNIKRLLSEWEAQAIYEALFKYKQDLASTKEALNKLQEYDDSISEPLLSITWKELPWRIIKQDLDITK